jgi:predicted small lipoprotein YifL
MVYRIRGMFDRCPASVEPRSKPLRPARLAWLGLLLLAAGCGQKGPLTLPAAASSGAPAAPASAPASK